MIEKQEILISYYRQGKSQRQIAKTMGLNRKTVKRYIAEYESGKTANEEQKGYVEAPRYNSGSRSRRKLTNELAQHIDGYIKDNERKVQNGQHKQCMRAIDMHEALLELGHDIGYTTVCNYVRQHKHRQKEIFIRSVAKPGATAQFDWGMVKIKIGGKHKQMMLAVCTLPYSNYRWAMLSYRQDMSSFLHSLVAFFTHIGGVPAQLVFDNMRTAVAKFAIRNADKTPTEDLLKISSYYLFSLRFCNAYKGNEKGHVENAVEYIRRKAFCRVDEFSDLDSAQEHLCSVLEKLNQKTPQGREVSIQQGFEAERAHLAALPPQPYQYAILQACSIDKYHTICVDTNHYSVPHQYRKKSIQMKLFPHKIVLLDEHHEVLATHERLHDKHQWVVDIEHYWPIFMQKPGALLDSLAFQQAPPELKQLYHKHFEGRAKEWVELCYYLELNAMTFNDLQQSIEHIHQQRPYETIHLDLLKYQLVYCQQQRLSPSAHNEPESTYSPPEELSSPTIQQHSEELLQQIQQLFFYTQNPSA